MGSFGAASRPVGGRALVLPVMAAFLLCGTVVRAAEPKPVAASEKASDKGDKLICKRFLETGSLVKGYRTCKTKREWEAERDNIRNNASTTSVCNTSGGGAC